MAVNLRNMLNGTAGVMDYMDLAAAWFGIALAVVAWRRLRLPYVLYMTVALLFNLSHIRETIPMCSVGRHTVELFPAFFLLGRWARRRGVGLALFALFTALYLYFSGYFVCWWWVG